MEIKIIKQDNGKYSLMGTFEIGESGEYAQRILVNNTSHKKALELKEKYS